MSTPSWGSPTPPPQYAPPAPPKKSKAKGCFGIGCGGLLAVVVIIGIVAVATGSKTATTSSGSSNPTVASTARAAAPVAAKPKGPATSFSGDGDYQVGVDIKAGTYRSAGPGSDGLCYWERDSNASGDPSAIIDNDTPTGSAIVTIEPSDKYFKTSGCQEWTMAG